MEKKEQREVAISLKHVDISFGSGRKLFKAVSDASFDIYRGETVSLVGESGSGKTTIGRAIVGINPCANGTITYRGKIINGKLPKDEMYKFVAEEKAKLNEAIKEFDEKIAKGEATKEEKEAFVNEKKDIINAARGHLSRRYRKELVRKIQMIFQDPAASLNERATIEYIISEGLYNFHLYKDEKDRYEKVEKVIEEVGLLPEHLTRYPHEFSGGQRQRVGIARSIVMEPEMIVADEPISALDVSIRAQVLNLLKKFQKERDLTYLFIAHDLSIVRFISDRIVVIHLGKIVEIAETEELFEHPLHPYTKSLMSAIPIPDPKLEKSKDLFVYHSDYASYEKPGAELTDIGNGHFVFGTPAEIEEFKKARKSKAK